MKERKKTAQPKRSAKEIFNKIWEYTCLVGQWAYKLRSVLLAIPVATGAIVLAVRNMSRLPEQVGMDLQANGIHAAQISRNMAVMGPLAVTALCLLLMFLSKRVVYPWLISVFSLVLPVMILIVNTYPY